MKKIFVNGPISSLFIAESIEKHNSRKEIGAHSIFLGQVRNDIIDEREVRSIEYSAYEDMAEEKVHEIREEAFRKFPITCVHIYHSLGKGSVSHRISR